MRGIRRKLGITLLIIVLLIFMASCEKKETIAKVQQTDDFRTAYCSFLEDYWEKELEAEEQWSSYAIYDIDKDGVPELLVESGTCEADYQTFIYSYHDNQLESVTNFHTGHSVLYSCPDENGIVIFYGHMGVEFVRKATLEDGTLSNEALSDRVLTEAEGDPDSLYSNVQEFVEGSVMLSRFNKKTLLPIVNYGQFDSYTGANVLVDEAIEDRFYDLMQNRVDLYAYTVDGFGDAEGLMTMEEFLSPNTINEYEDDFYTIQGYAFVDLNRDQQAEVILKLGKVGSEVSDALAILNFQEDKVYCYYLIYQGGYDFMKNGVIYSTDYDIDIRDREYPRVIDFLDDDAYEYYLDYNYIEESQPIDWLIYE